MASLVLALPTSSFFRRTGLEESKPCTIPAEAGKTKLLQKMVPKHD